ncbi:MAG TPA: hypothetical protein GX702_04285 [Chloroflexi bacterium]|nr:hypothetical protein [Chloroflexota bacterium]
MNSSLKQSILAGMLAPIVFTAGVVFWIYQVTKKVPFPVRRAGENEIVIGLVEPKQVPSYWEQWKDELGPILSRFAAIWDEFKSTCCGMS